MLGNLGCSGDEARLVDCPVVAHFPARDLDYDAYSQDSLSEVCDPFAADGGTFARIACGASSSTGVLW